MPVAYDIGMHNGDDTAYYLAKGFRVVAIEANPDLCRSNEERFKSEIADGRLRILNVAVSHDNGEIDFYLHRRQSEWGTIVRPSDLTEWTVARLPTQRLDDVIDREGMPDFAKIDIEGADLLALNSLHAANMQPSQIVCEAHDIRILCKLVLMGYDRFRILNGKVARKSFRQHQITTLTGDKADFRFSQNSSGPFGDDLPGQWYNADQIMHLWGARATMFGPGWVDVHAECSRTGDEESIAATMPLKGTVTADHQVTIAAFPILGGTEKTRASLREEFARYDCYEAAPIALRRVENATVLGPHLICLDGEGRLVGDSMRGAKSLVRTPYIKLESGRPIIDYASLTIRKFSDEITVLGSKVSTSFFHWTVEMLPRLMELVSRGEASRRPIVMRPLRFPFQAETLARMDVQPLFVEEDVLQAPAAIYPTHTIMPKGSCKLSPEVVTHLRNFADHKMGLPARGVGRRLYVSRADASKRFIRNEEDVSTALAALGFETILASEMSVAEQMQAFRSAAIVVGQHGAGLTLIALCQPGTRVVEMFAEGFLTASPFRNIASIAGLDYRMLLCPASKDARKSFHNGDLTVDVQQLTAAIAG